MAALPDPFPDPVYHCAVSQDLFFLLIHPPPFALAVTSHRLTALAILSLFHLYLLLGSRPAVILAHGRACSSSLPLVIRPVNRCGAPLLEMGLKSYFAPRKGEDKQKTAAKTEVANEKPSEAGSDGLTPLESPRPAYMSGSSGSSPYGSRPNSLYRNSGMDQLSEIKCDIMVNWLHSQQEEKLWCAGEFEEGVVLKKARGQYACCPAELAEEPHGFLKAVEALNVRVS